jgi:hypothetical protein
VEKRKWNGLTDKIEPSWKRWKRGTQKISSGTVLMNFKEKDCLILPIRARAEENLPKVPLMFRYTSLTTGGENTEP